MFRDLKAEEIECRVAQATEKGVSLLLYKDARCDQNILDETVGPKNWQRHHTRDNANCIVSIWDNDKLDWIEKEDTGTESNTEKEKGLASDSFKRACFNWGIGRELYTAPFIWINAENCTNLKPNERSGKWQCNDKFDVFEIEIIDKRITKLIITNARSGKVCFVWNGGKPVVAPAPEKKPEQPKPIFTPPTQFICADCGEIIRPYKDANGKDVPVRRIAASSEEKFGRRLCVECGKKAAANQ